MLLFFGNSNALGVFESGLTDRLFGTVRAVVLGASLTLNTVVGTGALLSSLRKLDIKRDLEGE